MQDHNAMDNPFIEQSQKYAIAHHKGLIISVNHFKFNNNIDNK